MAIANLNGKICDLKELGSLEFHRAIHYGDALFETIRMFDGNIPFLSYHFHRLVAGMEMLSMHPPDGFGPTFFMREISKLIPEGGNVRIRFMVFRKGTGNYTPVTNNTGFLIESEPLSGDKYEWDGNGLSLILYKDIPLVRTSISPFKTANSLPYVLGGLYAREHDQDLALLLNQKGCVADTTYANIWMVRGEEIITPPLDSGCIMGVIRIYLLNHLKEMGLKTTEENVSPVDLLKADSVFVTNAIIGVKFINQFSSQEYDPVIPRQILTWLNEKINSM